MSNKNEVKVVLLFLAITVLSIGIAYAVIPSGGQVTHLNTTTPPMDYPQNHSAHAGNVSELTIYAYTTTQTWQGYFGNVSGTIQLADSSDHVMYNWSLESPEGEVYAVRNDSIQWQYIQCFNFTATGTYDPETQYGNTSEFGMNETQIEEAYNIELDSVDGVNESFSLAGTHLQGGGLAHDLFYTASYDFSAGECLSTHLFQGNGTIADGTFQEVLLYEPYARQPVFVSILDEENPDGFDQRSHDFQMMVLEDGHGVAIGPTTYYFYVELE